MDEPERWLTSGDAPLEMREMLQAARADAPSHEAVARVGARLGNPPGGFGLGLPSRGLWLVGTVGLVGAGIAGYWALPTNEAASRAPAAQVQPHAPAAVPANAAPALDAAQASEEQPLSERTPPPKSGVTHSVSASGPAEVALIRRARAAVAQDPELALRLVEQHRQTFPQGKLAEEREVIAVQALAHLGRTKDAEGRAAAFAQEHPTSPHKARVERESKATE